MLLARLLLAGFMRSPRWRPPIPIRWIPTTRRCSSSGTIMASPISPDSSARSRARWSSTQPIRPIVGDRDDCDGQRRTATSQKLDEELQSSDYFDAAKFPTATFKSTKVEKGRNARPPQSDRRADVARRDQAGHARCHGHQGRQAPAAQGRRRRASMRRRPSSAPTSASRSICRWSADEVKIHIATEAIEAKAFAAGSEAAAEVIVGTHCQSARPRRTCPVCRFASAFLDADVLQRLESGEIDRCRPPP